MKFSLLLNSFLISLFIGNSLFSQDEFKLTGEQKAFVYHVIWKNKRLDNHFGKYFEYIGPEHFKRNGKTPKRDSVEYEIKQNGNNLLIRRNELGQVSKGMLLELCTKVALHELNKIIKHRNSEDPSHQPLIEKYDLVLNQLSEELPPFAMTNKDGEIRPFIKIEKILSPTYSTKSKLNVAHSGGAFDATETKAIVGAINSTIRTWVERRAKQYFTYFGGRSNSLDIQLMSAGDGGGFSGANKERKQDEWYRGLTHPIGFFYYQTFTKKNSKSGNLEVKAKHTPIQEYSTYGNDTITNIHFEVWGKSQERQTTVVIQKGMYSYILYGKDEGELLSPDSAYGKAGGTTYQMLIDELKDVHIAHYENLIYGKRGYDWQIDYHGKQVDICLEKIKVTEYKLNKIRYSQGSGNIANYNPKKPKKADPTGNSSVKKNKKTTQEELMYWYEKMEFHKGMIIKLQKEKEIALEILADLKERLGEMYKNLGYKILKYEEVDGIYTFEDSSTFNYQTQDFKFHKDKHPEEFNIRILAFDEKVLSSQADEVMIHWSVTEEDEDEKLDFNLKFVDQFNFKEQFQAKVFQTSDSVKIREFVSFINDNPKKIQLNLEGQGLGALKSNGKLSKQNQANYFDEYPNAQPEKSKELRTSTLKIGFDKECNIHIASFTDGLKIKQNISGTKMEAFLNKNPDIHINEIISAQRSISILKQLINDMENLGDHFFQNGEHKQATAILKKLMKKAKIKVASKTAKYNTF